ncbi:DUF2087 domain-containing protein [Tropicimonas sp. IMCC34043]|uniref:DUF2087 domain-containing protein n=1 Tax=Tropicimonas sp. IMCC34043 TaxID=2248760 RepID=UPI000E22EC6E|nr:DUF2087 domain-containing protein [Tropicimonas sp. IMCC34043]
MAREDMPLYIADVSAFSRNLRAGLERLGQLPGHLEMLGLIAASAGHRNYQLLKARTPAAPALDGPAEKALRVFDAEGRMRRWPAQTQVQALCLWVLWHRLPAGCEMTEPEVNAILRAADGFGDHVLLRRSLVDHKLVTRSRDGRIYRRIEQRPPEAARAVLRAMLGRPARTV